MGRWVGLVGCFVPKILESAPRHFDNAESSKIDDVLAEDGGLLHVLSLDVHLNFFVGQVGWTILIF